MFWAIVKFGHEEPGSIVQRVMTRHLSLSVILGIRLEAIITKYQSYLPN